MRLGALRARLPLLFGSVLLGLFVGQCTASLGDHLPDFKECVKVVFPPRSQIKLICTKLINRRSVKRKTVRTGIRCYVCRLVVFFDPFRPLSDPAQLYISVCCYGLAQPNATIPANMSSLIAVFHGTLRCLILWFNSTENGLSVEFWECRSHFPCSSPS